ncbi:hypothetical protein [Desulfogranum marinum]|uniref:hypothetical protein n=1 Tax=Desulfogranum marinum TaxID=453220 RepID=UPI0029C6F5CA|nr:hypothetical protein [Desulfogranum marinum]
MQQNDPYQTRVAVNASKQSSKYKSADTTATTDKNMQVSHRSKRPVSKMLLFGALSVGGYGLIFSHQALMTSTYTLGGWHAVLPVGTAFGFSFVHGAFASNLLSVIGLEPKKA